MPQSIVLVLTGAALSFVPGLRPVTIEPDFVLLLLLPPLLYSAGVGMSWRGFRANLRPILLLAIGCVLFTASAVAAACHFLLGHALGGRLRARRGRRAARRGRTDGDRAAAAAAAAAADDPRGRGAGQRRHGADPVRLRGRRGAERRRLGAGGAGLVSPRSSSANWPGDRRRAGSLLRVRRWAQSPQSEIILALLTPYLAFWPPHALGGSGVLAAVAAGLFVSWNGPRLIAPATRLQGYFVWGLVTHAIEGLLFLLIGLQARALAGGLRGDGWQRLAEAAVVVTVVVVVVRFVWVFPATYLPRLIPAVAPRDPVAALADAVPDRLHRHPRRRLAGRRARRSPCRPAMRRFPSAT